MFPEAVSPTTKRNIEKDGKFARKYVLTENESTKFFTTSSVKPLTTSNIVNDIKNRLDKIDLQEIYSNASIKSVFEI